MKVCVFGAGAIGGHIAALLAGGAAEVSIVARGAHLAAIRSQGLTLKTEERDLTVRLAASDDPAELGRQDYVVLAVKAHQAPAAAAAMQPLLGPDTAVVTAMNGIPFWYFYRHGGAFDGHRLKAVDPDGILWERIGPHRVIGCVVYTALEVTAPGVVQFEYGDRYSLGEPDGGKSARALAFSEVLTAAGLKAPVKDNIRDEIWLKLWGNLSFNPVSALTHATLDVMAADPGVRAVVGAMMREAQAIGETLGIRFPMTVERRIDRGGAVGAHKTSMLQDLERGRPLEIDGLVTVVQEMGRLTGTPTPTIDMVLALVQQRARVAGLYPA